MRRWFTERSTISEVLVDGDLCCFGLEDRVRAAGVKVKAQTAIPPGVYALEITMSERFRRPMPLVKDVPMFQGIRIHPGNTDKDTEGCLLVGTERGVDRVIHSVVAFSRLLSMIDLAVARGETITITYVNVNPPPDLVRAA